MIIDFHSDRPAGGEPQRDQRLGEMLARVAGPTPAAGTEERLHARIMLAAGPQLSRRREPDLAWWEYTAGWARAAIPLALAAGIVALFAAQQGSVDWSLVSQASVPVPGTAASAVVSAATVAQQSTQVVDQLIGPATREWVLSSAMQ
jgi:hypothetical protein